MDERVPAGSAVAVQARVTNRGSESWGTVRAGTGQVRLGVQLLDGDGRRASAVITSASISPVT